MVQGIFNPLGSPGLPKSAARLSRPACRITPLHGAAHAALPLAAHACLACMPRAKLYRGTTKQGFSQNAESALPPTRKQRFYLPKYSKPHGQNQPGTKSVKTRGGTGGPWAGLGALLGFLWALLGHSEPHLERSKSPLGITSAAIFTKSHSDEPPDPILTRFWELRASKIVDFTW